MNIDLNYAGMNAGVLGAWLLIGIIAGVLAAIIIRGPRPFGHLGDLLIALVGAFGLGWILRALNVDITTYVVRFAPSLTRQMAIWIDVFLVALIGAIIIRIIMRLIARS